MRLMRRPDDNERNYQARSSNYNDNGYQGRAMGHNSNRASMIFTYDEQGRVIELSLGQEVDSFSNQAQYNTSDYKYEYRPPVTYQSLLRDTLERMGIDFKLIFRPMYNKPYPDWIDKLYPFPRGYKLP